MEKWFVGARCAGSYHNPVEVIFANYFDHQVLGVLGTGKEISLYMYHARKRGCIFCHVRSRRDIRQYWIRNDRQRRRCASPHLGCCAQADRFFLSGSLAGREPAQSGTGAPKRAFHNRMRNVLRPWKDTEAKDGLWWQKCGDHPGWQTAGKPGLQKGLVRGFNPGNPRAAGPRRKVPQENNFLLGWVSPRGPQLGRRNQTPGVPKLNSLRDPWLGAPWFPLGL